MHERASEITGIKSDPVWKPDSTGLVRESRVQHVLNADTSSDLLLRNALQRRSLAFDNCRLVEYSVFEKWTDVLIDAYLDVPPAGFLRISLERELIGMSATTDDDEAICFNYNLDGCTGTAPGKLCAKGKHVCCKTGCYKPHSQRKHE